MRDAEGYVVRIMRDTEGYLVRILRDTMTMKEKQII